MEFINSALNKIPKIFEKDVLEFYPKITKLHKSYFKLLEKQPNLSAFLHGKPGTGKTLGAITLCLKQRSDKKLIWRKDFKFISIPNLLFELKCSYSNKSNKSNSEISFEEKIVKECRGVGILILDDLGVEKSSDWALQILYLIINDRYENEKTTIVTSNYSPEELKHKMDDGRIISRLMSMGLIIHCDTQYRNV